MVQSCKTFFVSILIILGVMCSANVAAQTSNKIVIAIDAGHGGRDPGAIGQNGLREKDVNFAVAKRLQGLLARDPMFEPVLTRTGDYFISVSQRSDIARAKQAHFLVSIHADAAQNASASGASVWVLSNKRADTELGRWLEQQDRQSELLGGVGEALANSNDNPYLSQTVIDLQFAHSQRVGYDAATRVLSELSKVGRLHKSKPEHVSLGVLRSPDIPSILVEVGFISNRNEERLLRTADHQNKLANAIYRGIRNYFLANPIHVDHQPSTNNSSAGNNSRPAPAANGVHVVKANETLFSIARQYNISVARLRELNKLTGDTIRVGQRLQVAGSNAPAARPAPAREVQYKVVAGDSLSMIAQRHGVSVSALKRANNLTSDRVRIGQTLKIPQ